jgi:hypothetical protein
LLGSGLELLAGNQRERKREREREKERERKRERERERKQAKKEPYLLISWKYRIKPSVALQRLRKS